MRYVLVLLLAASCAPLYVPNTRNAPLFREQGEAQISAYLTSGGFDAQGAYALTDHVALTGSYSYGSQKQSNPQSNPMDYTRKNSYGEVGIGYYDRTRSSRYEILAGYGIGQGTSSDQYYFFGLNNTVVATAKMQRIFLQPTLGTNNRDVNLSFTPRLSYVKYTEFTNDATGNTQKPNENAIIFLEPAATLKMRLAGNLHGLFQLGLTTPVSGDPYFDFQPMQVAIGLQIDTGGLRTRVY